MGLARGARRVRLAGPEVEPWQPPDVQPARTMIFWMSWVNNGLGLISRGISIGSGTPPGSVGSAPPPHDAMKLPRMTENMLERQRVIEGLGLRLWSYTPHLQSGLQDGFIFAPSRPLSQ